MIRVLIADDHTVVREGVKRMIEGAGDIVVAGEAASGPELLQLAARVTADAVVMDLTMPGMPGLEVLRELRRIRPALPVLILSMHPADQYAVRVLIDGAAGYVHKGGPPGELVEAVRTVAGGRRFITAAAAESLVAHVGAEAERPPHESLSNREFQVLCLMAGGKNVTEIARELALSAKTISTFRRRMLEKLGLQTTADLIRYAVRHGLVE